MWQVQELQQQLAASQQALQAQQAAEMQAADAKAHQVSLDAAASTAAVQAAQADVAAAHITLEQQRELGYQFSRERNELTKKVLTLPAL